LFDTWQRRLPASDAATSGVLSKIEQSSAPGGKVPSVLAVSWTEAPRKVEWFPIATRAVAVDNVVVHHDGRNTRIEFKPTVYKPEQLPGGRVDSVLVYEDAAGVLRGISVPIAVTGQP
jgi:hypothetical protein